MIGVASRNAKRAASLFDSPASRPPPIVAPEREKPGISASAWAAPIPNALSKLSCLAMRASSSTSVCGARRRSISAPKSRTPFIVRKIAADCGEANTLGGVCSSGRTSIPAGIVPTTSSQASFASVSSGAIPRSRRLRPRPLTIRTQSCQKKPSSTSAVARGVAPRKPRKYASFWWMFQPSRLGRMTLCPRLETGKSSDTPCNSPSTIAWPYVISDGRTTVLSVGSDVPARRALEPREDEQGDADEERREAVLEVVVIRPGLVAGHERRERLRWLDPVVDRHGDEEDADHRREHDDRPAV